jgi:hypothetical protein
VLAREAGRHADPAIRQKRVSRPYRLAVPRRQIDPICAPHLMTAVSPVTVQIGGSARGYQAIFVASATLGSPGFDGQPAVYLYIAALEVNVLNCRGQGRASWGAEACTTASAPGVLAKAGHGRARLRVPREVKEYSANVLASSLGLDPHHCRLRPGAR